MIFVPNKDVTFDNPESVEAMQEAAESILAIAHDLAPRRLEVYANSLTASSGVEDGVATGRVASSDFKAPWIEKGTGAPFPTPAFSPLRRAVEQAGFTLGEG